MLISSNITVAVALENQEKDYLDGNQNSSVELLEETHSPNQETLTYDNQESLPPEPAPIKISPRIIGGSSIGIQDAPWQVALLYANQPNNFDAQFCGGSLISDVWILTAAHCVDDLGASGLKILAGQNTLSKTNYSGLTVSQIVVHPNWDSSTKNNDIALLKLATPISISDQQRPISLAESVRPNTGTAAFITGWGDTNKSVYTNTYPEILQAATVFLVADSTCTGRYSNFNSSTMLCAAHPSYVTDSCQGDSGGPLAVRDSQNTWRLEGVTSFGTGCATSPYPGVYAEVATFREWIESNVTLPSVPSTSSTISLSGTPATNSIISIDPVTWEGYPTPSISYSWFRCSEQTFTTNSNLPSSCEQINSQSNSRLLVSGDLVGFYLLLQITASNSTGTYQVFSASTGQISQGTITSQKPVINGAAATGSKLSASTAGWIPADSTFVFQWLRDGQPIVGATTRDYTVTNTDLGRQITVQVVASKTGYLDASELSSPVIAGKRFPKPTVSVSGINTFGKLLTASVGSFGSIKPTVSYQWYRDNLPISGANKSTYSLSSSDIGKSIHVSIAASLRGYATENFSSKKTSAIGSALFTKQTPQIIGTFGIGKTLSASIGNLGASSVNLTYQWQRSGKNISGATSSRYKLTSSDAGKKISVKITAKKTGFKTATFVSSQQDKWIRTTKTATYWASSLPCINYGLSFRPCPSTSSGVGGISLYSAGYGDEMIVASSIPTVGAVQKWRVKFNEVLTRYDTFFFFPTGANPLDESQWTTGIEFPRTGYPWPNKPSYWTIWSSRVGVGKVHFVLTSTDSGFMDFRTVTIEYQTIL